MIKKTNKESFTPLLQIKKGGKKMARNFINEAKWQKQKYKRLVAYIDPKIADEFIKKLSGKPYSVWLKEKIENFLKNF
jgi:hypothetical protein